MRKKSDREKLLDKLAEYKVKCKCGHVIVMLNKKVKVCWWCGRKVYFDKKEEFKDKLKNEIIK